MELSTSRLIVGSAQFGQPYGRHGRPVPSEADVAEILELAATLGCAAVDTARAYGGSEAAIGRIRRSRPDAILPIVTKIRPLGDDETPADVDADVRESLAESLRRLGTRSVDTVLLHRAGDMRRAGGAAVRALRALRDDGRLCRWGVSVSDPAELSDALQLPGLGYVQLPFNVLDRRWLAPEVQESLVARPDVTIAVRSVFLQGILLSPDGASWPRGTTPDAATARTLLTTAAERMGRSLIGLCVGYVLGHPWVDAAVVGFRSATQLVRVADELARAPMTPAECERLEALIPAGSESLVNPALWPPR